MGIVKTQLLGFTGSAADATLKRPPGRHTWHCPAGDTRVLFQKNLQAVPGYETDN